MKKILFITVAMFFPALANAKICMVNDPTVSVTHTQLDAKFKAIYPVGAIYISTVDTNPATLFGFGTWEAFAPGRVLMGVGNGTDSRGETKSFAVGDTGGEYNHQLSVDELASHNHSITPVGSRAWDAGYGPHDGRGVFIGNTNNAGGDQAHNNLQPYIVVYMWRRSS